MKTFSEFSRLFESDFSLASRTLSIAGKTYNVKKAKEKYTNGVPYFQAVLSDNRVFCLWQRFDGYVEWALLSGYEFFSSMKDIKANLEYSFARGKGVPKGIRHIADDI